MGLWTLEEVEWSTPEVFPYVMISVSSLISEGIMILFAVNHLILVSQSRHMLKGPAQLQVMNEVGQPKIRL
jgi:hypothetical protein